MLDADKNILAVGDLVHVGCVLLPHEGPDDVLHLRVAAADREGRRPEFYLQRSQATVQGDLALVLCRVVSIAKSQLGQNLLLEVATPNADGYALPLALHGSQVLKQE